MDGQTVHFARPGWLEEYTVSTDGGRPDFVPMAQAEAEEERVADFVEEDPPQDRGAMAATTCTLNPVFAELKICFRRFRIRPEAFTAKFPPERGPPSIARRPAASSGDGLLAGFSNPQSQENP